MKAHENHHLESTMEGASSTLSSVQEQHALAFYRFPKLAPELRALIWSFALPGPHVVEVLCVTNQNDTSDPTFNGFWLCLEESCPPPSSLLRANTESRAIFLENWLPFLPILLMGQNRERIESRPGFPICYINPKIDTLYIGVSPNLRGAALLPTALEELSSMGALQSLRSLAIDFIELSLYMSGWNANLWDNQAEIESWEKADIFPELEGFSVVLFADHATNACERPRGLVTLKGLTQKNKRMGEVRAMRVDQWKKNGRLRIICPRFIPRGDSSGAYKVVFRGAREE